MVVSIQKKSPISLGIMQGRLSSKLNRPLQSFPENDWKSEFLRASEIGFNNIEWLLDGGQGDRLLQSETGRLEIMAAASSTGVKVTSLCAHSMMDGKLFGSSKDYDRAMQYLIKIIDGAIKIGANLIVLPLMDRASIKASRRKEIFILAAKEIFSTFKASFNLAIESELPAAELVKLAKQINIEGFGLVADLGNLNALNYNVCDEIEKMKPMLKEIHIKDRRASDGPTSRLGCGNTPLSEALLLIHEMGWTGPMVLETPIFMDWEKEALHNYSFVSSLFNK